MHELLGGAFPKRHHVDCGLIAIICKVPVLGHYTPEPSPLISIAVTAVSINLTTISITVAASDDEEGVVLPRG
jgi:hypothetical protein